MKVYALMSDEEGVPQIVVVSSDKGYIDSRLQEIKDLGELIHSSITYTAGEIELDGCGSDLKYVFWLGGAQEIEEVSVMSEENYFECNDSDCHTILAPSYKSARKMLEMKLNSLREHNAK